MMRQDRFWSGSPAPLELVEAHGSILAAAKELHELPGGVGEN